MDWEVRRKGFRHNNFKCKFDLNRDSANTHDRPDLIARVFELKKKALLNDITDKHIFGVPVAHVHVIEFQKRGLPHMHALIILREEDKPRARELIDKIVCAEIPDANQNPRLRKIVLKNRYMDHVGF